MTKKSKRRIKSLPTSPRYFRLRHWISALEVISLSIVGIFDGVFKHAGKLRDYDITKREWVLDSDTVNYLNWEDLRRAIDYDISHEKEFSYKGISPDAMVEHITQFVSGLWQIHAFCEGNTRTTAVFTILYLRSIGFKVDNSLFARHSWYFRNALVRANYKECHKRN